jgi:hypothetical protein
MNHKGHKDGKYKDEIMNHKRHKGNKEVLSYCHGECNKAISRSLLALGKGKQGKVLELIY